MLILKYLHRRYSRIVLLIAISFLGTSCVVTRQQLDKTLNERFSEQEAVLQSELDAYNSALEQELTTQSTRLENLITTLDDKATQRFTSITEELKNLRGRVMLAQAEVDATVLKLETMNIHGQQALQAVKEFLENKSRTLSNQKKAIDDLLLHINEEE